MDWFKVRVVDHLGVDNEFNPADACDNDIGFTLAKGSPLFLSCADSRERGQTRDSPVAQQVS